MVENNANCGRLSDQDRHAISAFYRAFEEGEADVLDTALAIDWRDVPLAPGQLPGREGMKPLIREFAGAFPDASVAVNEIIAVSGRAAVRAEITGTHAGAWFGVPATGRRFTLALHDFHHTLNGQVIRTWHLEDWFGWLNQIGISLKDKE